MEMLRKAQRMLLELLNCYVFNCFFYYMKYGRTPASVIVLESRDFVYGGFYRKMTVKI